MKFWSVLPAMVAGGLVGCAGHVVSQGDELNAANTELRRCINESYYSADSADLKKHLPLRISEASLDQMSDPHFVTDAEGPGDKAQARRRSRLSDRFPEQIESTSPNVAPNLPTSADRRRAGFSDPHPEEEQLGRIRFHTQG